MNCAELARRIQELQPEAMPTDVSRICLMMFNQIDDYEKYNDEDFLMHTWSDITMRLQAGSDQQEAMTEELQDLAKSDPKQFSPEQIWILVRAIKVQSQLLQMYDSRASIESN